MLNSFNREISSYNVSQLVQNAGYKCNSNFELVNKWFLKNKPDVVIISAAKVGGISANNNYPVEFLLNLSLIHI